MKARIFLTTLVLTACTAAPVTQNSIAWRDFAYEGFGEKVNRLAGDEAIHCGVVNLVNTNDPTNKGASLDQGKACIARAIAAGQPFKFGTVRIPLDSYLFEAVVGTSQNEFWIVHYDVMVDGTDNQHFIRRCRSLEVKNGGATFAGSDCVDISTSAWLADIPEQNRSGDKLD